MKLVLFFIAIIHLVIVIAFGMVVCIKAYMPPDLNVFWQGYIIIIASFIVAGFIVALINYTGRKWL